MKCYIKGYNKSKYEADSEKVFEYNIGEISGFAVVNEKTLEEKMNMSYTERDPYDEYLVVYFPNGSAICYCNSKIDIFKY